MTILAALANLCLLQGTIAMFLLSVACKFTFTAMLQSFALLLT